jgi:hypothetical protein
LPTGGSRNPEFWLFQSGEREGSTGPPLSPVACVCLRGKGGGPGDPPHSPDWNSLNSGFWLTLPRDENHNTERLLSRDQTTQS